MCILFFTKIMYVTITSYYTICFTVTVFSGIAFITFKPENERQ